MAYVEFTITYNMGLTKLNFSENWVLQNYVFFQPGEPAVLHQLVGQLLAVHVAGEEGD